MTSDFIECLSKDRHGCYDTRAEQNTKRYRLLALELDTSCIGHLAMFLAHSQPLRALVAISRLLGRLGLLLVLLSFRLRLRRFLFFFLLVFSFLLCSLTVSRQIVDLLVHGFFAQRLVMQQSRHGLFLRIEFPCLAHSLDHESIFNKFLVQFLLGKERFLVNVIKLTWVLCQECTELQLVAFFEIRQLSLLFLLDLLLLLLFLESSLFFLLLFFNLFPFLLFLLFLFGFLLLVFF